MGTWTNPNVQGITPIFQGGSLSPASNVQTITPAAGFNIVNLANVALYQSYDINLYGYAVTPGIVAAPITMLVQLLWYDDKVSGIPVFEEQWWIWLGRTNAQFADCMAGCGPMHGAYMSVNISIPTTCTSNMILQYFNLFGSPRPQPYSDWRQDAQEVDPETNGLAILLPGTSSYENQLASVTATLTNGSSSWVPIGLYAGPVYFRFQAGAAPQNTVCIASAENVRQGDLVVGTGTPNIISSTFGNDANDHEAIVILPRSVCYIAIHQNATTTAGVSFSAVGQQAA